MAFVDWSDSLLTGVGEADFQHKKLVEILNNLHDSMRAGKANNDIDNILNELKRYTVYHFATEEKFMAKYNYPELAQHKKEHEAFVAKVNDFLAKRKSGQATLTMDVLNFLRSWLSNHIMGTDKKYGVLARQVN